jgi:hypothetical protein
LPATSAPYPEAAQQIVVELRVFKFMHDVTSVASCHRDQDLLIVTLSREL